MDKGRWRELQQFPRAAGPPVRLRVSDGILDPGEQIQGPSAPLPRAANHVVFIEVAPGESDAKLSLGELLDALEELGGEVDAAYEAARQRRSEGS